MATTSPLSKPRRQHGSDVCPVFTWQFSSILVPPFCDTSACARLCLSAPPPCVSQKNPTPLKAATSTSRGQWCWIQLLLFLVSNSVFSSLWGCWVKNNEKVPSLHPGPSVFYRWILKPQAQSDKMLLMLWNILKQDCECLCLHKSYRRWCHGNAWRPIYWKCLRGTD